MPQDLDQVPVLQMENARAGSLDQLAVVRDDQHGFPASSKILEHATDLRTSGLGRPRPAPS